MNPGDWSIEALCDLVSGCHVLVHDANGNNAPIPHWIEAEGGSVDRSTWVDGITAVHPTDRANLAREWWKAWRKPGEITETTVRWRKAESWHSRRLRVLNLIDHPEVGALLILIDQDEELGEHIDDQGPAEIKYESAPWVIHYLDNRGYIQRVDGMVEHLYGRPREQLIGENLLQFIHVRDHADCVAMWLEAGAIDDTVCTTAHRIFRPDKTSVWVESTVMNQLHSEAEALVHVSHDVTERRAHEAALRASREDARALAEQSRVLAEEFRLLAEQVPAGVFRVDATGQVTFGNARWYELLSSETPAISLRDIAELGARDQVDAMVADLVSPTGSESHSLEVRSADGSRLFSLTCRAVGEAGADARTIIGALQDATMTAELRHRAEYDLLTGALNRHTIDRRIDVAVRNRTGVLLVFVDLDEFKLVNDRNGHDAGDVVLREVAERLQRAVRPSDDVGRYGGDEFVIICYDTATAAEAPILDRIERVMADPVVFDGGRWMPRVSVGTARPLPGESGNAVVQRADQSMYAVKRARPHHASGGHHAGPHTGPDRSPHTGPDPGPGTSTGPEPDTDRECAAH